RFDVLGQIAQMLAERGPRPDGDVRSIEAYRSRRRPVHAHKVARQRGFAGARWADDPQHFTRLDAKRYTAQDRLGAERRYKAQAFDQNTPVGPRQQKSSFARWIGSQKLADSKKSPTRRNEVAPGSDNLLNRLQRSTKQNAGCKHGTDGRKPLDHQIGPKSKDDRLHREPQKTDDALHGRGAVACGDLALKHSVAVAAPAPQQAVGHAHRAHYLGVAQAHLGEAVVARRRLARFRKRWLDDPFIEQRHRDQKNRAPQRNGSKKWVHYKDDSIIPRRPG